MSKAYYRKIFHYRDGKLIWCNLGKNFGHIAGCVNNVTGYRAVKIAQKNEYVHRVIWEYHNGPIPDGLEIDHKDTNRDNNKIDNLRLVTSKENKENLSYHIKEVK